MVTTSTATERAILDAMAGDGEHPSRVEGPHVPEGTCAPPPERAWGWSVQLYALRTKKSWGVGD
ncbi:MAG TPA: hypothetical protein VNA65_10465, partial [Candidatus Dormibacteraeota bacterium]|nr:hypothetical protein [Candidatus Dormibacteraeota bacterium]